MIRCKLCGAAENLQRHHIIPLLRGGEDSFRNRMMVCVRCHAKIHGHWVGIPRNYHEDLNHPLREFTGSCKNCGGKVEPVLYHLEPFKFWCCPNCLWWYRTLNDKIETVDPLRWGAMIIQDVRLSEARGAE